MNLETGLPESRGDGGRAIAQQLHAHVKNIEWVRSHDPYAGLMVSMHRTGLWQTRYGTIKKPEPDYGRRTLSPEIQSVLQQLESSQEEEKKALGAGDPKFQHDVWVNYRLLQLYDILSLYFCGSGIGDDGHLREQVVAPIPTGYDSDDEVELHLIPTGDNSLQVDPYPFDASPICIGLRVRLMEVPNEGPFTEEATREAFFKAPRRLLEYQISR